jgi:hypothetical protein
MLSHRSAHYWLWFLLFGGVSALVAWYSSQQLTAEAIWLTGAGLVGVILGSRRLGKALARPYDLVIGLLFTGVGLLGILHNFGVQLISENPSLPHNAVQDAALMGLSLSVPYALIHTALGLTSLNHGLKSQVAVPTVMVGSGTSAS